MEMGKKKVAIYFYWEWGRNLAPREKQKIRCRVSTGLDSDQDQSSVSPDLGPHCLQRLSADDNFKLPLARKKFWGTLPYLLTLTLKAPRKKCI